MGKSNESKLTIKTSVINILPFGDLLQSVTPYTLVVCLLTMIYPSEKYLFGVDYHQIQIISFVIDTY